MSDWDKWFEDEAAAARRASDDAGPRARAKAEAERRRHIELGWITEDGEPGPNAPQEVEDEEENEE